MYKHVISLPTTDNLQSRARARFPNSDPESLGDATGAAPLMLDGAENRSMGIILTITTCEHQRGPGRQGGSRRGYLLPSVWDARRTLFGSVNQKTKTGKASDLYGFEQQSPSPTKHALSFSLYEVQPVGKHSSTQSSSRAGYQTLSRKQQRTSKCMYFPDLDVEGPPPTSTWMDTGPRHQRGKTARVRGQVMRGKMWRSAAAR